MSDRQVLPIQAPSTITERDLTYEPILGETDPITLLANLLYTQLERYNNRELSPVEYFRERDILITSRYIAEFILKVCREIDCDLMIVGSTGQYADHPDFDPSQTDLDLQLIPRSTQRQGNLIQQFLTAASNLSAKSNPNSELQFRVDSTPIRYLLGVTRTSNSDGLYIPLWNIGKWEQYNFYYTPSSERKRWNNKPTTKVKAQGQNPFVPYMSNRSASGPANYVSGSGLCIEPGSQSMHISFGRRTIEDAGDVIQRSEAWPFCSIGQPIQALSAPYKKLLSLEYDPLCNRAIYIDTSTGQSWQCTNTAEIDKNDIPYEIRLKMLLRGYQRTGEFDPKKAKALLMFAMQSSQKSRSFVTSDIYGPLGIVSRIMHSRAIGLHKEANPSGKIKVGERFEQVYSYQLFLGIFHPFLRQAYGTHWINFLVDLSRTIKEESYSDIHAAVITQIARSVAGQKNELTRNQISEYLSKNAKLVPLQFRSNLAQLFEPKNANALAFILMNPSNQIAAITKLLEGRRSVRP